MIIPLYLQEQNKLKIYEVFVLRTRLKNYLYTFLVLPPCLPITPPTCDNPAFSDPMFCNCDADHPMVLTFLYCALFVAKIILLRCLRKIKFMKPTVAAVSTQTALLYNSQSRVRH